MHPQGYFRATKNPEIHPNYHFWPKKANLNSNIKNSKFTEFTLLMPFIFYWQILENSSRNFPKFQFSEVTESDFWKFHPNFSEFEFLGHDSCSMRWTDFWKTRPYLDDFSRNRSVLRPKFVRYHFSSKYSIFDEFFRNRYRLIRDDSYYMSHMMEWVTWFEQ